MINLYAETDMNEKVMIRIAELPDVKTCFKFHKAIYKYHQDNVDFKLEDEDNLLNFCNSSLNKSFIYNTLKNVITFEIKFILID